MAKASGEEGAKASSQGELPLGGEVAHKHNTQEPYEPPAETFEQRLAHFLHAVQFEQISYLEKIRHLGQLAETPHDMDRLIEYLKRRA